MSKRGQSSSMSYKDKANLHFVEQEEPAFIKAMKAKLGYKEPAKLEDKFDDEAGPADFDDDETDLMRMKEEDTRKLKRKRRKMLQSQKFKKDSFRLEHTSHWNGLNPTSRKDAKLENFLMIFRV
ncbi:unnamed protein product [Caenorhabditis brenneri]